MCTIYIYQAAYIHSHKPVPTDISTDADVLPPPLDMQLQVEIPGSQQLQTTGSRQQQPPASWHPPQPLEPPAYQQLPPPASKQPLQAVATQRQRTVFARLQCSLLEGVFQQRTYLLPAHRARVTARFGLPPRVVHHWFQNRRAKWCQAAAGTVCSQALASNLVYGLWPLAPAALLG